MQVLIKFFLIFLVFGLALAQQAVQGPSKQPSEEGGVDLIKNKSLNILENIIKFLFSLLMLAGSALLIFLGIKYISAKGKIEELHKSLLYLILGIVLLITSFFLPNLIKNFIESLIE